MRAAQRKIKMADIPELTRYMTIAQVAKLFGVSKTAIYNRIYAREQFPTLFRLGGNPAVGPEDPDEREERPIILLLRSEVQAAWEQEQREKADSAAAPMPQPRKLTEFHRRVKAWGIETGWCGGPIGVKGAPRSDLVAAYESAHPDDLRPEAE